MDERRNENCLPLSLALEEKLATKTIERLASEPYHGIKPSFSGHGEPLVIWICHSERGVGRLSVGLLERQNERGRPYEKESEPIIGRVTAYPFARGF